MNSIDETIEEWYAQELRLNQGKNQAFLEDRYDQIEEQFLQFSAELLDFKNGLMNSNGMSAIASNESINKSSNSKLASGTTNIQDIGKEKQHNEEEMENFKKEVDFINIPEKTKQLYEMDPLKMSI